MKAHLRLVVPLLILLCGFAAPAAARTEAAIVVDAGSGRVLYARRADTSIYPASLTKMMTLYMLFEAVERGRLRLDDALPVSRRAAGMPASRLGLRAGESIRVEDAIRALVVKSANDVAVVVAEALGGSEAAFARAMTGKARALGMSRTTFVNASGLPDDRQQTTVRDLATLARRLISDFPQFYDHFSAEHFRWRGHLYRTHNGLIGRYAGADGLKTGYIRASGFNLAASAVRDGRRVIAVYVGGPTAARRDREVVRLLDFGFERLGAAPLVALGRPVAPPEAAREVAEPASAELADMETPAVPVARPVSASAADLGEIAPQRGPARERRVAAAAADRLYGVQVGAFLRPDDAYRAARTAIRRFPDQLLDGTIEVSPRQGRRKVFYRARIAGFGREEAEQICVSMKRQRLDCMVVRYEEPVTVAAR